jgi:hypothetical protein
MHSQEGKRKRGNLRLASTHHQRAALARLQHDAMALHVNSAARSCLGACYHGAEIPAANVCLPVQEHQILQHLCWATYVSKELNDYISPVSAAPGWDQALKRPDQHGLVIGGQVQVSTGNTLR